MSYKIEDFKVGDSVEFWGGGLKLEGVVERVLDKTIVVFTPTTGSKHWVEPNQVTKHIHVSESPVLRWTSPDQGAGVVNSPVRSAIENLRIAMNTFLDELSESLKDKQNES